MSSIYHQWRQRRPRPAPATPADLVEEWERLADMWEGQCEHGRASVYRDTAQDLRRVLALRDAARVDE